MGHSRPEPVGRRSSHVRYAPKATVRHRNAVCREGPRPDMTAVRHNDKLESFSLDVQGPLTFIWLASKRR